MKAVGYQKSLPIADDRSLVDTELPKPAPAGRDLLVKVRAVSVNPVDTKMRMRAEPPAGEWRVLGWDAAGVVETAGLVRTALEGLGMKPYVKTTGSRGLHVYVAIVRGPTQKDVWRFAKRFAVDLAGLRPDVATAEYKVAARPNGRVLVDYNQNAWGRTLASAYSPRPRRAGTVSAPLGWDELDAGASIDDFDLRNLPARLAAVGDLWAPLLAPAGRFDLAPLLQALR